MQREILCRHAHEGTNSVYIGFGQILVIEVSIVAVVNVHSSFNFLFLKYSGTCWIFNVHELDILCCVEPNRRVNGLSNAEREVEAKIGRHIGPSHVQIPDQALLVDLGVNPVQQDVALVDRVGQKYGKHKERSDGAWGRFEGVLAMVRKFYLLAVPVHRLEELSKLLAAALLASLGLSLLGLRLDLLIVVVVEADA